MIWPVNMSRCFIEVLCAGLTFRKLYSEAVPQSHDVQVSEYVRLVDKQNIINLPLSVLSYPSHHLPDV